MNLPARSLAVGGVLVGVLLPGLCAASTLLMNSSSVDLAAAEAALLGTGQFAPPDLATRAATSTPTLPDLQAHDAVLLWTGDPWDDAGALGDVLADYLDAGGALVLAAPALNSGEGPAGRFESDGFSPVVVAASGPVSGELDFGSSDAAHPALLGLSDVRFPDLGQGNPALSPSGELIAVDTAGNLVLAGVCDRSVFALNLHPPDLDLGEPSASADAAALLAQTILATGLDAAPSADAGGPYAVDEGATTTLDGGASAAGDLGPLSYAWDLDEDGQFDDGSSDSAAFDATGLDGPTAASPSLRVTDRCGRTSDGAASVDVANVAPSIAHLSLTPAGNLGATLGFVATGSDPVDLTTVTWSWDDGSPDDSGEQVTHAWLAPGDYAVTVTVADDDGGEATGGGTVVITNPGPTLTLLIWPIDVDEGDASELLVAAEDALGAPVALRWDYGDGTPEEEAFDLLFVQHAWADDGLYSWSVEATDDLGATATLGGDLTVVNVAPTPTASPPTDGTEGLTYSVSLTADDPGDDPLVWSLLGGPSGAAVSPEGLLEWVPDFDQVGSAHSFQALVSDGDGGATAQDWTVTVAFADGDGDGLPDTWETQHGLDTTADDAADDLDGDGLSNAAEFAAGTDPSTSNAPGAPVPLIPVEGETVATASPTLVVLAAGDVDGDVLTHGFEVYADAGLTTLLDSVDGLPTVDGQVAWSPAPLPEDADAYWRARAEDAFGVGPWTTARALHVDAENAAPPVPAIVFPDGTTVSTPTVTLRATAGADPEGDEITVLVRLYGAALLATLEAVEDGGEWIAVVGEPLADDVDYTWTAEAIDVRGGSSGESSPAAFHLDATNQAPPPPAFDPPLGGAELDDSGPVLTLSVAPDPDGDPLLVRVEVATSASFADAAGGTVMDLGGVATVSLPALDENRTTHLRARSEDDRGGASAWVVDSAFINAIEEAPSAVVFVEPTQQASVVPEDLVLRWAVAADPDGDPLRYEVAVTADEAAVEDPLWSDEVTPGDEAVEVSASPALELEPGGYRAHVRAVDDTDRAGPWSTRRFVVDAPEPGEPADLGPGDGAGWTCGHAPGGSLLALLTIAGRRRRRSAR